MRGSTPKSLRRENAQPSRRGRDRFFKTRGRADRYSFLVRLFHPLLHAGLARRTVMAIFHQLGAGVPVNPFAKSELLY